MRSTAATLQSNDGASIVHLVPHVPLDAAIIELAARVETPAISDVSPAPILLDPAIRSVTPGRRLIGPALTVELPPGDNLLLHVAIRLLQPGQILVVSANGPGSWSAPFGDLMGTSATAMGCAGAVVDGFVRDPGALADGAVPVFARGASPQACDKQGGGTINAPIRCGDRVIHPGDVVIGDDSGLVAVPRGQVRDILAAACEKVEAERRRKVAIAQGAISPGFVEERIRDLGLAALVNEPEWRRGERIKA
jgi:4-hydroxy-4-methyl-2-oxoglutarate aldolase